MRNQTSISRLPVKKKISIGLALGASLIVILSALGFYSLVRYHGTVEAEQARFIATMQKATEGDLPPIISEMLVKMANERTQTFKSTAQTLMIGSVLVLILFILIGLFLARHNSAEFQNKSGPTAYYQPLKSPPSPQPTVFGQNHFASTPTESKKTVVMVLAVVVPVLLLVLLSYLAMSNVERSLHQAAFQYAQDSADPVDSELGRILGRRLFQSVKSAQLVVSTAGLICIVLSITMIVFIQRTARVQSENREEPKRGDGGQ